MNWEGLESTQKRRRTEAPPEMAEDDRKRVREELGLGFWRVRKVEEEMGGEREIGGRDCREKLGGREG